MQHALCEMLTEVLRPLVRANLPVANAAKLSPALLAEWHAQVGARAREEVGGVQCPHCCGCTRVLRGGVTLKALPPLVPSSSSPLNRSPLPCPPTKVLRAKNDIGQWVNKHNKHINVRPRRPTPPPV